MSVRSAFTCIIAIAILLPGCASLVSNPAREPGDGLHYWLPKKDIRVKLTIVKGMPLFDISPTAAYADIKHGYRVSFARNLIGKNELTIEVGTQGLLKSIKSVTTSQLGDALSAAATSLANVSVMQTAGALAARTSDNCPADSPEFSFTFTPPKGINTHVPGHPNCKVTITPEVISAFAPEDTTRKPANNEPGVYYRQDLPVTLELLIPDLDYKGTAIVLVPNHMPPQFLPIARSLFADNLAEISFTDGIPTKYHQTVNGEAVALLGIPAKVLEAYFTALGTAFTRRTTATNNAAAELKALQALALQQQATDRCLRALAGGDPAVYSLACQ